MDLTSEQRLWLGVLRLILIEIRALEDDRLPRARDLANLMHNVPSALFVGAEVWSKEKQAIIGRAEAAGLGQYLQNLIEHCDKSIK